MAIRGASPLCTTTTIPKLARDEKFWRSRQVCPFAKRPASHD
jgi:hypothetical protein